jgi:hypothetical protein
MKYLVSLIAIIGCIAGTLYFKGCLTKKEKTPVVQYINPLADTVKHYHDMYNIAHAQVEQEVNNVAAMSILHKQFIDSLCHQLGIKDKELQSANKMMASMRGQFYAPLHTITVHDTVNGNDEIVTAKKFAWNDDYMQESGLVYDDHIDVNYSMQLSFTTTSYWKRKHHFLNVGWGKKIYYLDASCPNENVLITGLQAIKIN